MHTSLIYIWIHPHSAYMRVCPHVCVFESGTGITFHVVLRSVCDTEMLATLVGNLTCNCSVRDAPRPKATHTRHTHRHTPRIRAHRTIFQQGPTARVSAFASTLRPPRGRPVGQRNCQSPFHRSLRDAVPHGSGLAVTPTAPAHNLYS